MAHLAIEVVYMHGVIIIGRLNARVTALTFGKFSIGLPLLNRLAVTMQFMAVVTTQTIKVVQGHVYIGLAIRINTLEIVTNGGCMTGNTNIGHIGCFIEIMASRQSPSAHGWSDHMTVTTGSMTYCTIVIVTLNLMLRELVKFRCSIEPASHGHNTFHTGTIMNTGGEIISNIQVAGSAFVFKIHGWV